MLFPVCEKDSGWVPGDSGLIIETVRDILDRYTIDRQRIVAHGMGIGGQMAIHLGFNNRDLFRGVVATGAVASNPRENIKDQRLAFYIASGELDPLVEFISKSAARLVELNYPVTFRKIEGRGREYFQAAQRNEVAAWIDSLDKQ
jgi:predicted esterase